MCHAMRRIRKSVTNEVEKDKKKKEQRRKGSKILPVTLGFINNRKGGRKTYKPIRVLFDSGCTSTIILQEFVDKIRLNKDKKSKWLTKGGTFVTKGKCTTQFYWPEFENGRGIEWEVHVDGTKSHENQYDMIVGSELMNALNMDCRYSSNTVDWLDLDPTDSKVVLAHWSIPMKKKDYFASELQKKIIFDELMDGKYEREESFGIGQMSGHAGAKMQAKEYKAADIYKVSKDCEHLSEQERQKLHSLLSKYEKLFQGKLGTWDGDPIEIELKEGAKPYSGKPYKPPHAYLHLVKEECERLCRIGVLEKVKESEWGHPTFIIPKKNKGGIRWITDLRELNKRCKRKPYPLPNIQDTLLGLEGFTYATALDLNMGYYHIRLSEEASKMTTIIMPWGKYQYKRLPMGLANSPDIFQEKMNSLFNELSYVRAYIDDLLVLTKGSYEDHLKKVEVVLARLENAGLQVNAEKSFFAKDECEYLGYVITRKGIRPQPKKIDAVLRIEEPKTIKQLRSFIGMINYYRDVWPRRSHLLAPLTKLMKKDKSKKFEWGPEQKQAFEALKKMIAKETLLAYPNFNKPFDIHTDASDYQLGAVISQNNKPIAFYSRKLNSAQRNYTTAEKELLSIVETFKEFRTILMGHEINVFTDHKNLTSKTYNNSRVIRWRMVLEEFGPNLVYIPGKANIVADALSRMEMTEQGMDAKFENLYDKKPSEEDVTLLGTEECHSMQMMASFLSHSPSQIQQDYCVEYGEELVEQCFAQEKDDDDESYPLTHKRIDFYQRQDKQLLKLLKENKRYQTHEFPFGGGTNRTRTLIVYDDKRIVIPKALQKRVMEWYHTTLMHPGAIRTEETIKQHFYWNGMQADIRKHVATCDACQRCKRQKKKYGELPPKEPEKGPWEKLCVDLIGPYTIRRKNKKGEPKRKDLVLHAVTMIDPVTGWFEIAQIQNKTAEEVSMQLEMCWLTRYPWPQVVTIDRGKEFIATFFKDMMKKDYGIKCKYITTRNAQANSIIERVHQVLGNLMRTFELEKNYLDEDDPWAGLLAAAAFAIRSTYHTTLKATPGQLVYGRDMVLNMKHVANWDAITQAKRKMILKNNKRENSKRIPHTYKVGDEVLLDEPAFKYETNHSGPYTLRNVYNNGTVSIKKGAILDTVNIRRLTPYKRASS